MATEKRKLTTGEYYHVYNRGVDKRTIYRRARDYNRFLQQLYAFNDFQIVSNYSYYAELGFDALRERERQEPLVAIVAFCLMPNHFHLVVRQVRDEGLSLFMQKVGAGYAKYFNLKHKRNGTLFQDRFQAKHVHDTAYLHQVVSYVHLNPLALSGTTSKLPSSNKVRRLQEYAWSSLPTYLGRGGEGAVQYDLLDHATIKDVGLFLGNEHEKQLIKYLSSPGDDKFENG